MNINNLLVLQVGKYYPPYRGGMETHLQQLAHLLKDKVKLSVLVANDRRSTSVELLDGIKIARLSRLLTVASTPVCPTMAKAISAAHADLVHIHFPNPAAILAYLASNHRGPVVVTWHSDVVRQTNLAALFQPILDGFLRRCAAILVSSPNYLTSSSQLVANRDKCQIIPFGIAPGPFQRPDLGTVSRIRGRFGPRIILTVGRLVYYKGLEFLIRAMSRIKGAQLLIAGDGPLRRSLELEAQTLGVGERVSFLGSVDDLVPYYHACDVFALPSVARSEAFGIVQLEALAAGKPVVNTLLDSGVPFVSPDGVTGFSVAPGNPEALAAALNRLLEDTDLRQKFGQAGLSRVIRDFSVEKMLARILEVYGRVVTDHYATNLFSRTHGIPPQIDSRPRFDASSASS